MRQKNGHGFTFHQERAIPHASTKLVKPASLHWSAWTKSERCAMGIDFVSFYVLLFGFWNYYNSVVDFYLNIMTLMLFLDQPIHRNWITSNIFWINWITVPHAENKNDHFMWSPTNLPGDSCTSSCQWNVVYYLS
jgi:hypothetical protein